jgi:hypothetical protein
MSRSEAGEDEVVILHVGLMAAETCFVLGAADGLSVDEAAEAPSEDRRHPRRTIGFRASRVGSG